MSAVPTDVQTSRQPPTLLEADVAALRALVRGARERAQADPGVLLPGNACFLDDGRVLCRARVRGDSRYPYGRDGFNFWVYASGYMHANDGLYFVFVPLQEGQEPPIALFLGQRLPSGAYRPFPLTPVPYIAESESHVRERCTVFGHDAAYYLLETDALVGALRVFVDQSHPEHVDVAFSTLIENRSAAGQSLYLSAYLNPFCRHQFAETCEDRWFKRVNVEAAGFVAESEGRRLLPPFRITVNEDLSRFQSVSNHALVRRATNVPLLASEVCTSRRAYMGDPRISLAQAKCLSAGGFAEPAPLTVFSDNAVVGDLTHFELPAGTSARFEHVLSLMRSEAAMQEELRTSISSGTVDRALSLCRSRKAHEERLVEMRFARSHAPGLDAETFNRFLPFLMTQVRICAQTKGYMQPSPNSLIGIRDVFQAVEGHLYYEPDLARRKIIEALAFVLVDGRCPRQYSLPVNGAPGRADLREFIDQGAWVIAGLHTYVAVTGDAAILDEVVGYHRVDPGSASVSPASESGTVLDHLVRIIGFLDRNRDPETRLLLALYGDWNDAVDGLGVSSEPGRAFGTGVSVMASCQLYQSCGEMIELLERYYRGQYLDLIRQYRQIRDELEAGLRAHAVVERGGARRIVHGWGDRRRYYVGSFEDSDGQARDSLTSNAFWVLSGLLGGDATLGADLRAALRRLDSTFGLKTFEPGFAPNAPGVGRVRKLPIGTAENGATYIHATLFGVMALFELGDAPEAWRQIQKVLPFAPHQTGLSHSPFVMPNSYVANPALNLFGQNMNDWQTGSSNVFFKVLIRYVVGFWPLFDRLWVAPAPGCVFESFEYAGAAQGRPVRIRYGRGDVEQRTITLNGEPLNLSPFARTCARGAAVERERLDSQTENLIVVTDPIDERFAGGLEEARA